MILLLLNKTNDINTLSNLLSGFIGVIIGAIIAAVLTFIFEKLSKDREIKFNSLNAAHYISFILMKERATLQGVQILIDSIKEMKAHKKNFFRSLFLEIKQDTLEKILMYPPLYKFNYAEVIQSIASAEQTYRDCFELIKLYNKSIQKLLEKKSTLGEESSLVKGYRADADSYFDNIISKYGEAVKLNEYAKAQLDELCKQAFGSLYKPIVTNGIVKATEELKKK